VLVRGNALRINSRKANANDAIDLKVMVRALRQKLPFFLWRSTHLFDRDLDAKDRDGLVGVPVDPFSVLIGSRGFYLPDPNFSSHPVCIGSGLPACWSLRPRCNFPNVRTVFIRERERST